MSDDPDRQLSESAVLNQHLLAKTFLARQKLPRSIVASSKQRWCKLKAAVFMPAQETFFSPAAGKP